MNWKSVSCKEWKGRVRLSSPNHPYGVMSHRGKDVLVHRFVFALFNGWWPINVCHRCDNTLCIEPLHLFAGTHAMNMQDMVRKGRNTKQSRNSRTTLHSVIGW